MILPKHKIGFISFRLVSVYLFIHGLDILASLGLVITQVHSNLGPGDSLGLWTIIYLVWGLLYFGAAVLFYLKSTQLSMFLFGEIDDEAPDPAQMNESHIERIVYTIVGVYILVTAMPHVAKVVYTFFSTEKSTFQTSLETVTTITSLVVGGFLLLSAKGMQSFVQMVRNR